MKNNTVVPNDNFFFFKVLTLNSPLNSRQFLIHWQFFWEMLQTPGTMQSQVKQSPLTCPGLACCYGYAKPTHKVYNVSKTQRRVKYMHLHTAQQNHQHTSQSSYIRGTQTFHNHGTLSCVFHIYTAPLTSNPSL